MPLMGVCLIDKPLRVVVEHSTPMQTHVVEIEFETTASARYFLQCFRPQPIPVGEALDRFEEKWHSPQRRRTGEGVRMQNIITKRMVCIKRPRRQMFEAKA